MRRYDVVVAGLGAAGSATALQLARRGARVLGLDRFHPPHTLGSSHGRSRIYREAYFEHPLYVPLMRQALEFWRAIEHDAHVPLIVRTGALSIGDPEGQLLRGTLTSAREHGIPHELLTAAAVRRRFPGWEPADGLVAVYEAGAGMLRPEAAIEAMLALAADAGAELRFDTPLLEWRADDGTVSIRTGTGTIEAERLVLAAGPWLPALLSFPSPFDVERQQVHWFDATANFAVGRAPVGLWELEDGGFLYTIPDDGNGLKAAFHHGGAATHPDRVDRTTSRDEESAVHAALAARMPRAAGATRDVSVCLYTNTPDGHFLVDTLPDAPSVIVVSACSGHGFKFAPAIGAIAADLALDRDPMFDIAPFRFHRFAS